MKHTTKRIPARQGVKQFTAELASPAPVILCGDDEADEAAIREAASRIIDKLPALAEHLGVKLDEPESVVGLLSPAIMALARETVPGFQLKPVKRAGRKIKKDAAYYMGLAVAYELFDSRLREDVTKSAFATKIATAEVKAAGSRSKRAIVARAKQIRDDLSRVSHPDLRAAARLILSLTAAGKTPDEIAECLKNAG